MTLEEASNAVRLYVEAKEFSASNSMGSWSWVDRLDDCLADIRAELSEAAQDDGKWSRYLDMTRPTPPQRSEGRNDAKAKLELWFFRDMFQSNRLALFSLFGFKAADIDTMGKQQMVFRRILAALATVAEGSTDA